MKSILLSIRPEYVAKILNGEKTIEIRKKFPKDYVGWVYMYCTKDKKYKNLINRGGFLTGMVVARFWCDKVKYLVEDKFHEYYTEELEENKILKKSCLTYSQLFNYLKGKVGYAIHISKLEVFEKPKELNDFVKIREKYSKYFHTKYHLIKLEVLYKAPSNYCYIESEE